MGSLCGIPLEMGRSAGAAAKAGGSCSPTARAHQSRGPLPSSSRRRAAAGQYSCCWPESSGHPQGEQQWLRAAGGPGSGHRAQRPSPPPGEAMAHPPCARGAGTHGMARRGLTLLLDVDEHAAAVSPEQWGWTLPCGVCEVRGGRGTGLRQRFPQTLRDRPGQAPSSAEFYCNGKPGVQVKERRGPRGTARLAWCLRGSSSQGWG